MTRRRRGFTLVELVVTLAVAGLVAGVLATVIGRPMLTYEAVGRRVRLVDGAENVLRHLERDVHKALPNSLRLAGGGTTLEIIPVLDGGRYRRQPGINPSTVDHTAAADWLDFAGDASFNLLGRFRDLDMTYGTALPAGTRIAIYSTDTLIYAAAVAGSSPGTITPVGTSITIADDGDEDQIQLSSAHDFLFESPEQRLYVVESPITYQCDLGAGTVTRYAGYGFAAAQPTNPAAAPLGSGRSALLAEGVTRCDFEYVAGTSSRNGLLTVDVAVEDEGERVNLFHQIHVENTP